MFETCLNLTSTNAQRKIWSKIVPKQSGNYTIKLSWVCQGIFGISFKSILLTQPTLIWNISLGKKMTSPGLHRTKIAQGRIKLMNLLLQNFVSCASILGILPCRLIILFMCYFWTNHVFLKCSLSLWPVHHVWKI